MTLTGRGTSSILEEKKPFLRLSKAMTVTFSLQSLEVEAGGG